MCLLYDFILEVRTDCAYALLDVRTDSVYALIDECIDCVYAILNGSYYETEKCESYKTLHGIVN